MSHVENQNDKRILSNEEMYPQIEYSKTVSYREKYPEIDERYKIEKSIGSGRYSKVYKGQDKRGDCKLVALKVINRNILPAKCESPYDELSILKKVHHENIIVLVDHIDSNLRLTLVFEIAEKGDLFQLLKERGPMSEMQTASVINDIGSALFYLHNDKIIHRNVKLENILVFRITHYHIYTKLADFSLAIEISNPIRGICGSINYISPEMADRREYMYPVDIWALGVVCYILLSALPPFYSINGEKEEILEQIRNCDYTFPIKFWSNISNECKELIELLLHHDPDSRMSAIDLLCHKWVVSNGNVSESSSETMNKMAKRRNEYHQKLTGIKCDNHNKSNESKRAGVLNCMKSFFKGETPGKTDERLKPILESSFLRFHRRPVKLPSTKENDPNILFD